MRIKSWFLICLWIMLTATGCVNFSPSIPAGRWESESPHMYIEIGKRLLNPVSGFADIAVDIGEIIHEDGSATIIHFRSMHGNFTIYEYNENWSDEENELFHGEYKVDGDTLTLQCSDGTEIVLSHAVDPLAKETEGS